MSRLFWKLLLTTGLLFFLFYGLSLFLSEPTIETMTTNAPQFDSNNHPVRDGKPKTNGKKR